jgi:hypothetical protein
MEEYRHNNHGLTARIWAEAVPEILVPHTRTQETKSLVSTFNHMRQQSRARQPAPSPISKIPSENSREKPPDYLPGAGG